MASDARGDPDRPPSGLLEVGWQKLASGIHQQGIEDRVVEAHAAREGRVGQPRAAAECRRDQPVRRRWCSRRHAARLKSGQRLPDPGEEFRRVEDRGAIGFEVDDVDVAPLEPGEIAVWRGRGGEGCGIRSSPPAAGCQPRTSATVCRARSSPNPVASGRSSRRHESGYVQRDAEHDGEGEPNGPDG